MTRCSIIASALVFLCIGSGSFAEDRAPRQMIADLFDLQARIAEGDKTAVAAQAKALGEIDAYIASAPVAIWKDRVNTEALISFVLSGGSQSNVLKLYKAKRVNAEREPILRGALAYMSGHPDDAKKVLLPLDPRSMENVLGAQIAYVQAALMIEQDKKRAGSLFDLAGLLAPGGLLEEVSLRRRVKLAADMGQREPFARLASQ